MRTDFATDLQNYNDNCNFILPPTGKRTPKKPTQIRVNFQIKIVAVRELVSSGV